MAGVRGKLGYYSLPPEQQTVDERDCPPLRRSTVHVISKILSPPLT